MLIVKAIPDPQNVVVFCREHTATGEDYSVLIHDESTQVDTLLDVPGAYDGVKISMDIAHDFVEGRFYFMKIYHPATGDTLNFSKIFCTDQTDFEKFTVLDGYYKQIDKPEQSYIVKK